MGGSCPSSYDFELEKLIKYNILQCVALDSPVLFHYPSTCIFTGTQYSQIIILFNSIAVKFETLCFSKYILFQDNKTKVGESKKHAVDR